MKKALTTAILFLVPVLFMSQSLSAIPAFARKYGFNCNMCHVGFPKLNDFGQRYRDNGYQIPGQAGGEKSVFETGIPLALRTTVGYSTYSNGEGSAAGFHIYGLDLLAAGVLHKNISFFFVYTPRIDDPAADFTGPQNGNNPAQLASVESANMVFSNLVRQKLNLRIGRFEPAYELLSSKRMYYLLEPYEFYVFSNTLNPFDFSANQLGVEATGRFNYGIKYAAGFVNGNGGDPDNNKSQDFYFVLSKIFGPGEGLTAGQRLDVFGFFGSQPTDYAGSITSPLGDINGKNNRSFYRLGANLSLNWKTLNLRTMAFTAKDNQDFNDLDPLQDYSFWGGVVELDWASLANNRLIASLMYNWVRPPGYDDMSKVDAFSVLARYYMGSWYAVNMALHAEYTYRTVGVASPLKENYFTLALDFDF